MIDITLRARYRCQTCREPEPCACERKRTFQPATQNDKFAALQRTWETSRSGAEESDERSPDSSFAQVCSTSAPDPAVSEWLLLERQRRLAHPELRGVYWEHDHAQHDPTDSRGELGKRTLLEMGRKTYVKDRPVMEYLGGFQTNKRVKAFGGRAAGGVEWDGGAA